LIILKAAAPDVTMDEPTTRPGAESCGPAGWKALIYRHTSLLHVATVAKGPDRRAVLTEANALINRNEAS
jgi:hypothetical protein